MRSQSAAAARGALRAININNSFSFKRRIMACIPCCRQPLLRNAIQAGEKNAFARFAEQHDAFLATVHESFALSGRSQYRRAEGYYHFLRTVRRIAFLEEWLEDETVLFDESLSQKVYAVMPWDRGNEAHARRYFEHMPLPTALIHLDADAAQVVRQLRERERATGKLIPGHRGLSDDELMTTTDTCLHFARIGAECLQARGCLVLSLTASEPPEQNARRVTEFIQGVAP
ncbi:hypothetical protein HH1059_04190 [Halorhodospira halochloris]|uniref:Uncharacterized protein n=1 Tax=Halorhodospira halochloris TaxID=1052 RepID=A0A0X8X7V4_HALHR|nr:hypothetical protein HH1059_04190 [Halorhodospira halochloris]